MNENYLIVLLGERKKSKLFYASNKCFQNDIMDEKKTVATGTRTTTSTYKKMAMFLRQKETLRVRAQ